MGDLAAAPPINETNTEPEDDGLGPVDDGDDGTGIPGGAQPQDDRHPGDGDGGDDGNSAPPAADLPDDSDGEAGGDGELPTLFLLGDYQLGNKVKGRTPDTNSLHLKGGKIELQGQFNRGDRLLVLATVQVTGDNDQDSIEKSTGEIKSTSKQQGATVCGTARLEDWLKMKLEGHPELLEATLKALDVGAEPAEAA